MIEPLRNLSGAEFADTLQEMELSQVLSDLDPKSWGSNSRSEFLKLLESHAEALSIEQKAEIISCLAKGATSFREETVIRNLFLTETGAALTELKLRLDTSRTGHDLLAILSSDIDSPALRFDIVRHFQNHPPEGPRLLRVVSDIDDTVYSSLKDQRYPSGTVYPGVLEVYGALTSLPPVFLTARPELALSMMERLTHKQLRRLGWSEATVLSGSLPGLLGHRRMAEQKARTLTSFVELYPEYRFVFFGDSGQSDWAVAKLLLSRKPRVIEHAFIHKLSPNGDKGRASHPRIQFFEDYFQLAPKLHELAFLNDKALESVSALANQKVE